MPAARQSREEAGWPLPVLPTGVRVFLILGAVLLPLTLISILASAETGRSAAEVRGERLMTVLETAAGRLRRGLVEDQVVISASATVQANARAVMGEVVCRRVIETVRARHNGRVAFVVADRGGVPVCGLSWGVAIPRPMRDQQLVQAVDDEVTISRRNNRGWVTAIRYPASELDRMLGSVDLDGRARIAASTSGGEVTLRDTLGRTGPLFGKAQFSTSLTGYDLELAASVPELPPTTAQLIAILLPFMMLVGSAVVGWLLVYRLFTRQLSFLTRQVEGYQPGTVISLGRETANGAREVHALGIGLRDMSQLVAENISDVEAGLARQTSLTREVHHRVKNNLQVIASLISLHSRSAEDDAASAAYRTIQRRVDALAVVHRNHYAGTEISTGVSLTSLVSELATSLQASAEEEAEQFVIITDVEPASVSQDTATSIAFLISELAELALTVGGDQTLRIEAAMLEGSSVRLTLQSQAFTSSDKLERQLTERYSRVLLGLSRQLREQLEHDDVSGAYRIRVPSKGD